MATKWTIIYRGEAEEEIAAAIRGNRDLKEIIIQRLRALEDFPPEKWFEIRKHHGTDLFTSDRQMVRISGEADEKTMTVWIHKVVVVREPRRRGRES